MSAMLELLHKQYQQDDVNESSIECLGYPSILIHTMNEVTQVYAHLQSTGVLPMQLGGKSEDQVRSGMSNVPEVGIYHAAVQTVEEDKENGCINLTFEILNGTVPGQEKKTIRNRWFCGGDTPERTQRNIDRLTLLAIALGLLKDGEEADVHFPMAAGRQLIIEVVENVSKKDGKPYKNVAYSGYWKIGHPDVVDVPLDQEAYQMMQGALAASSTPASAPAADSKGWNI